MEVGTVFFVIGDSPISKIIEKADGKFSHVSIAVSATEVIETNWNMRSRIVVPKYKNYVALKLNLTPLQRYKIIKGYKKYINKPYDFLQIVGLLIHKKLNDKRKLICSELVYNLLTEIGYLDGKLKGNITPNQLYTLLTTKTEGKIK